MENKNEKFHLRLNLFDGIVLVLAVLVAGFLVWNHMKPADSAESPETARMEYVVRFQRWPEGSSQLVQVGDKLLDNVKNFSLGTVKAVEAVPATGEAFNEAEKRFDRAEAPGFEDVLVTVESEHITVNEDKIMVDGGVQLRVGTTLYIRGNGYMASGPVVSIERAEEVA